MYESKLQNQQALLELVLRSENLVTLTPFKLAFVIGKHKMLFSSYTAFLKFTKCADSNSFIFSRMHASLRHHYETVTVAALKSIKAFCCALCEKVALLDSYCR